MRISDWLSDVCSSDLDAEHEVERRGAHAGAGSRAAGDGVRRGDIGIGAVVDVEHDALPALETDAAAAAARLVEALPDAVGEGQDTRRQREQAGDDLVGGELRPSSETPPSERASLTRI